jgi:hypothetical protein
MSPRAVGIVLVVVSTVVAFVVSTAISSLGGIDLTPIGKESDPELDQESDGKR